MMFSEIPPDFVLFKQQNITAAKMFQNLLASHAVDPAHQETISMADIYDVTDTLATLLALDPTTTKAKTKWYTKAAVRPWGSGGS